MKTYLEQLEQLEQLERLPENHFCFNPVTSTPEVPISSRKPQLLRRSKSQRADETLWSSQICTPPHW